MTWNAEATIQLIGVLISILGIGIACYNHECIVAALCWAYSMISRHETRPRPGNLHLVAKACGKRLPKPDIKEQLGLESLELRSWDDPDIEAGAATSAWAEEVRREIEKCWA